jgi:hydrophobic/amphiphilic exporter-1 (mainly G- bacteria), HAE1 family
VVDFFIHRPVFATVCALLIILAGAVCIPTLPISLYPTLAPPQVTVTSNYVGANSQTVESAVTIPLETQINGVQGMRYISSTSSNDGTSFITTTFQTGYSLDIAAVDVQNRVSAATGRLPQVVNNTGITITKANSNYVFAAAFYSDGRYSDLFISNYLCERRAQAHPRGRRCDHLRRAQICHAAMARSGPHGGAWPDQR